MIQIRTMSQRRGFKYDVAFSFLADDEGLAAELEGRLRERLSTFLYSKQQERLAGTDGEIVFASVFGKESRTVVVLYREDWGTTPWTRIEQDAIRNRAFEEGYGFSMFMVLQPGAALPPWLPKTQIWVDFDRYGIDGALAVIEARVQESGGDVLAETFEQKARRQKAEIEAENDRQRFLDSGEGVRAAHKEIEVLHQELERSAAILRESGFDRVQTRSNNREAALNHGQEHGLSFIWSSQYSNTLNNADLSIALWRGPAPLWGDRFIFDRPTKQRGWTYCFDRQGTEYGWREKHADSRFLSSRQLAEHFANQLVDAIQNSSKKG